MGCGSKVGEFRNSVVTACFRSLQLPAPLYCDALLDCALSALLGVLQESYKGNAGYALPKDVLHGCLRPVLKNLQNAKELSLPLLQGLTRMLYALNSLPPQHNRLFNVNFPEKLCEHLQHWTTPDRLLADTDRQAKAPWGEKDRPPPSQEPLLAAALLNLFHLIQQGAPSAAPAPAPTASSTTPAAPAPAPTVSLGLCDKFLDPLVRVTLALEAALPKYKWAGPPASPFVLPLTRFLVRCATPPVTSSGEDKKDFHGADHVLAYFLDVRRADTTHNHSLALPISPVWM